MWALGTYGQVCKHSARLQDLEEDWDEEALPEDRGLAEAALGGLELGGSVWSLDRDKNGPWTLVRKPRAKASRYVLDRPRRESVELDLFHVGHEDVPRKGKDKVAENRRYEMVTVTADSGAADHVAPIGTANHLEVRETTASRQGVKYVAANGQRISNLGQRKIQGVTDEGTPLGMTWQVADVKKPLASVGRMCDAGNVAVFTKSGGYVVPGEYMENVIGLLEKMDKSTLRMKRENGVYNFNLWVPRPPVGVVVKNRFEVLQELEEEDASGFTRLGERLM